MKQRLFSLLLLLISVWAAAEVLTPAEALARLGAEQGVRKLRGRLDPEPAMTFTAGSPEPAVYLFRSGADGLMALSAESRTPALLGYSDSADPSAPLPPALEMLLDSYAREIGALRAAPAAATAEEEPSDYPSIDPICKTRWDQLAPYNDDCPIDPETGRRCVTGCVATAMAQVLNVYRYPEQCTGGREAYTWERTGTTLSMNFDTIAIDWDDLYPTYWAGENPAGVARLMSAVGHACHMEYGPGESGANAEILLSGLVRHFDYDCTATYQHRSQYPLAQWIAMVHEALTLGYPLYYDGYTPTYSEGHAFVIDGYSSDGLFHVNWGWSGVSDGYFRLTALDPNVQGTGGADHRAYGVDQGAIFGLKPGDTSHADAPLNFFTYNRLTPTVDSAKLATSVTLTFGPEGLMYNLGPLVPTSVIPAVTVTHTSGRTYHYRADQVYRNLAIYDGIESFAVKFPRSLPTGVYYVSPSVYDPSQGKYYEVGFPLGRGCTFEADVDDGVIFFQPPELPELSAAGLWAPSSAKPGQSFSLAGKISNPSPETYTGRIAVTLTAHDTIAAEPIEIGAFALELAPDESRALKTEVSVPYSCPLGNYSLQLVDDNGRAVGQPRNLTVTDIDAISLPEATQAPAEYFDLQGRRIAAPTRGGFYIRRQGSNIEKLCL